MESAKIKFLFFLGLTLGAVYATPQDVLNLESDGCPQFWDGFDNRCYKYVPILMTWTDAELHCLSHGANLVSIHSEEEENFVKALIRNFDPAEGVNWIGLSDGQKEGTWLWSDGSKLSFTYWKDGEPNNQGDENCVHTNWGLEKKWNDKDCQDKFTFVCASRKLVCSCT